MKLAFLTFVQRMEILEKAEVHQIGRAARLPEPLGERAVICPFLK